MQRAVPADVEPLPNASVDAALARLHAGDAAPVEDQARAVLRRHPERAHWRYLLALALAAQERHAQAREELERLRNLSPHDPALLLNLGNACLACGDGPAALQAFEAAACAGAEGVAYWLGHGIAALACQHFQLARGLLARALQAEPDAPDVRLANAECLCELEQLEAADRCISALDLAALSWLQRADAAWILARCGHEDRADALLQDCIRALPGRAELRVRRALLLERLNRLDDVADELARAGMPATPMHALARSRWLRRLDRTAEAQACLAPFLADPVDDAMAAQLQFEAARLLDAEGRSAAAMDALARAHRHARRALAARHPQAVLDDPFAWLEQRLQREAPACWRRPARDGLPADPVFLVGFPRSGTTLMQRILGGHPALQPLEERPALEAMIAAFHERPHASDLCTALDGLDARARTELRVRYWREVGRYLRPDGRRLLDKYPLSFSRAPYLARCFPDAQLVFMLRHPCDVVLSCHMQAFGLNGGVLAFATLDSTARAYARLMDWWHEQRTRVGLSVLEVRHEDLVDQPGATLRRVSAFLRLPVVDGLEDRLDIARPGRIRTPSYAQVIRPLNRSGVGRWQRYRAHFSAQALDLLAPWVRRLGYSLE